MTSHAAARESASDLAVVRDAAEKLKAIEGSSQTSARNMGQVKAFLDAFGTETAAGQHGESKRSPRCPASWSPARDFAGFPFGRFQRS
jgi:hypothetical protein